ncbi:hypothetical protein [Glycomyces algeriensis]|jgi:hypothetical protein|nr:hypothetical protein [Glycomyces algeriensis]MDA1365557.1 hypothetical protein [Glycomyces algeriensis]MDR7351245.1 hypothetical protein [Glycomyces algeriensis]
MPRYTRKPLVSSIPLWMRDDRPRRQGMDRWKGPHSQIISATPGLEEYRQIHLAESNPGLWPAIDGVETAAPTDRRIDGVAEVTMKSLLSPLLGREQTKLAHLDEVNLFRRTVLYAGPPYSARWYDVGTGERPGARALVYLRRRASVGTGAFRKVVTDRLVPALARAAALKELRTQMFMQWRRGLWDSPNVAHDNPVESRFHASLILGFTDADALRAFFAGSAVAEVSSRLPAFASAVHAYEVEETLTFVEHGRALTSAHS